MNLWKGLRARVSLEEPLRFHTSFKIGGPARFFIEPRDTAALKLLLSRAKKYAMPVLVIGAGSNILASDDCIEAVVLRLNSGSFKAVSCRTDRIDAGGGVTLAELIQTAKRNGLSGIEFLAGIPGTVGGALVMNAGAWGKDIADSVEKVKVMDYNGKMKILPREKIKFGYRKSSLDRFIVLNATFKLAKGKREEIELLIRRYLRQRKDTQDASLANAGCIFKNPLGDSAGRLIDLCSLKGKRIGNAVISKRHANFILNCGKARSQDVLKLMGLIRCRVRNKFGINLQPEIKIWR